MFLSGFSLKHFKSSFDASDSGSHLKLLKLFNSCGTLALLHLVFKLVDLRTEGVILEQDDGLAVIWRRDVRKSMGKCGRHAQIPHK